MATQNISIGVNVSDNGTAKKVVKSFQEITQAANAAQKAAQSISTATKGTAGSRAVYANAAPKGSEALQQYGNLRGSAGVTGASGRDFANQAQGLGGLVRVYATFAANIFAVSAAFEALNKAAQTDRLIASLDKLSISAGSNLKNVAKSLQEASGQALSFGEAIQFTNIGTTAGLAGKQIESLTKIARGAATVLGRDVGDSIRRIIQGTAKQEQEILDELGIFLKANQAYEKYAQTYNLKIDELSGQQKTQAYANEVERLGQKFIEFAEIPDPFTQFTATGKDALNSLLSSINSAIIPVLELFAKSEGAIKSLIGLISTVLLRQAIPELASALTGLFSFDKARLTAEATAASKSLQDKYIATTAKLVQLKQERERLMVPTVTGETLGTAVGASAYTRGKSGQEGLSVQRLTTTILKDEDLARFKKLEDVQVSIGKVLQDQVKDAKDGQVKLDALIQKKLISANSTLQEVKLGKEGEEIAKRVFTQITAQNAALAEQLALDKAINVTNREAVEVRKTISTLPKAKKSEYKADGAEVAAVQASTAASLAAATATATETSAKLAQNVVLKENISIRNAYNTGLAVAANAEAALTTAMAAGLLPTLKATGVAMKAAYLETLALATGQTLLSSAAILAGGAVKVLSLSLKGLMATLNIVMIPIMLLITAWELFGDVIKGWLPDSVKVKLGLDAESKALEEVSKKLNTYSETVGLAGLSLKKLYEIKKEGLTSFEAEAKYYEKESALIRNLVKESEALNKTRTDAVQALNLETMAKEAATKGVTFSKDSFATEQLITTLGVIGDQKTQLQLLAADFYELDDRRAKKLVDEKGYNAEILALDTKRRDILVQLGVVSEQNASRTAKAEAASENLLELSDKIAKKSKEVKDATLGLSDSDIVSWYEKINTLTSAMSAGGARVEDLKTVHANLEKAVKGSSKAQAEAAPVIELLNSLMAMDSASDRADAWKKYEEQVRQTTGSVAKILETSAKPTKVEEYSSAAKTALIGFKDAVTESALQLKRLDIDLANSAALDARKSSIRGFATEEELLARQQQENAKNALQYTNAIAKAEEDYQRIVLKRTATPEEKKAAGTAKAGQVSEAGLTKSAADAATRIANENERINSLVTQSNREFDTQARLNSELLATKQAQLTIDNAKFEAQKSVGLLTETELVQRSAVLESKKIEAQLSQDKDIAEFERAKALAELKIRAQALPGGMANEAAVANEKLIQEIYTNRINLVTQNKLVAEEVLAINKENELSQARYNDLLNQSTSLTQNLSTLFGELGTSIGGAITSMISLAQTQEKHDANVLKAKAELAKFDDRDDGDDKKKALKDLEKAEKARTIAELDGYAAAAGSAKKMFKEKTGAYKAFAAVEKTLHVISMAMKVKEMIQDGIGLATKVAKNGVGMASDAMAAGVAGVKAVVNAIASLPFPLNIAAGAATAAVVAGLLGSIGGKGPSVGSASFVPNAEQRQETQGTGMSYDSQGNKVENGGGVFGDSGAKLDSINKGIQTIKDNSIEGLFYDNRMLKALESIAQSITGAAQSIYSTPGIRSGLNFGSMPGTGLDKNWYQDIPLIGGLLGGVFGGGTTATASIQDAGIQLRGTLEGVATGMYNSVMQYKDVLTQFKEDGGWFGSDDYWSTLGRETNAVTSEVSSAFRDVFASAKELFTNVADSAGISSQAVTDAFSKQVTNLDISLKGLSGEDVVKELNASISSELDKVAKTLFSGFEKFKQFGEGYTDTVIRVVDANMKIDTALRAMGSTFDVTKDKIEQVTIKMLGSSITFDTLVSKFDISEAIVKMSGSLENFNDQAKFFIDNFLTDTERMAITSKGVKNAFDALNLSSNMSRDQFRQLVRAQDLSTQTGRSMYQGLMDIQESFFKVTQRITDLQTKSSELEISLLQAQGRTSEATAALELLATEGMNQAELAVYNYNKSLQAQIDLAIAAEKANTERLSLEQKVLQIFGDTAKLRELELEKVDINNKALQTYIWYLEDAKTSISEYSAELKEAETNLSAAVSAITSAENKIKTIREQATADYVSATQKVAEAQQAIADIAAQAAQRMYDLGKSLRGFIKDTLLGSSATTSKASFDATIAGALSGNNVDIENVQSMAEKAIETARQSSRTSLEFAGKQASILASVGKVASYAESQGKNKPEEDPLVAANKTLEESLQLQSDALAVAKSIDASLTAIIRNLFVEYTDATAELQKAVEDKTAAEAAAAEIKRILEAISTNTGLSLGALKSSDTNNINALNFLTNTQVEKLGKSTDQIPEAIASAATSTNETIAANISEMYNGTLYSIAINTSSALPLLSANLTNQGSMISLLTAVVSNTQAIAEGVKAGSGAAPAAGSTNIFSKIGSVVSGVVGGLVSGVKKVWNSIFSDVRMKEDISLYKTLDNGINIYDFNYKAPYSFALGSDRKRGVLAQEVEGRYPDAVSTTANGMKQVDYSKLPIPSNILKFAKGGVFSNSVVNTPTTFSLAQMGEAGPEAVMPLRRDAKGNLGVTANVGGNNNQELLVEIRALRGEVEKLRYEAQATAKHTNKSAKILERVTRDGESLLVTDSATV